MDRLSSLHGEFVGVKTPIILERLKLENLDFGKKKSHAPDTGGSPIEKCQNLIESLLLGFNCTEGILTCENSYRFRIRFEAKNHF